VKDQKLNYTINEDETLVKMTDKEKKEQLKNIDNLLQLMLFFKKQLNEDRLQEGFKETQLSLLENYTIEILKHFNYESLLAKEKEERIQKTRQLNIENRELRRQLGDKVSAEDVREMLKNIENKFHDYWRTEGFGFCGDVAFTGYSFKVRIAVSMLNAMLRGDKEEIQQKKESLKSYGFKLVNDGEREENALSFSENNIELLKKLLSKRFTDYTFSSINSRCYKDKVYIRDIDLYIYNYDDLINLPEYKDE
jgi:hypothetical protein